MTLQSALYVGSVAHHRFRPRRHDLRYRVFWMLIDLDEIDVLARRLRLFARGRFNAVSFYEADHGDGSGNSLRSQVERHLAAAGIAVDGGAIRLLCMPRIFGHGFNPLSIFYCYDRSGALTALLYEVHNTFHERHTYLIPIETTSDGVIRQACDKAFYVSPFVDMGISYAFRITPPRDHINVGIRCFDADGPLIFASLVGKRVPLSDGALLELLVLLPLVTLKVVAAIHWHALLLWWKGIKVRQHPVPPADTVTIVRRATG